MLLPHANAKLRPLDRCHDGVGVLMCRELLADYAKKDGGIKFIHDNELAPGVSIGEHTHHTDEEVYFILTGTGEMRIDGVVAPVGAGDACVTRRRHSHSLTNTGSTPMRMLVIGVNP